MIYTSVDLGSNSIKIVVVERINDQFHVLASTKVRSLGIKKGIIKNKDLALESLNQAILNINNDLGINIKQVLVSFPLFDVNTSIETSEKKFSKMITGSDVKDLINQTISENISKDLEVVYVEPIVFSIDNDLQVFDPKGLTADILEVRLAVSTIDKNIIYDYLDIFNQAGLEVVDFTYGIIGDYYENCNATLNKQLGVVVNIGHGKTEIGIFNKGIILKGSILPVGSKKIDKDISFIYKINKKLAKDLKETFAVSVENYADSNDVVEANNNSGEKININQVEISQIVEARLLEIIKSVKNEINNLTNREISYIIITGGITNLVGFPYLVDNLFKCEKIISNMTDIGVRSNDFATCLGLIKYFDKKMKFRNIEYSMVSNDEKNELTTKKKGNRDKLFDKLSLYLKN